MTDNKCVREVSEEMWYIVHILEDAYLGSRYLFRRYGSREYSRSKEFVERVFTCLGI